MKKQSYIKIAIGTKVMSRDGMVTLGGDIFTNATRETDGAWRYSIGRSTYICAGGCAKVVGKAVG